MAPSSTTPVKSTSPRRSKQIRSVASVTSSSRSSSLENPSSLREREKALDPKAKGRILAHEVITIGSSDDDVNVNDVDEDDDEIEITAFMRASQSSDPAVRNFIQEGSSKELASHASKRAKSRSQVQDSTRRGDRAAFSDSTLSPISSEAENSESSDHEQSRTTDQFSSTSSSTSTSSRGYTEATEVETITSGYATPSSSSPSRRSARIVSAGSSVQKALQRRDELDEKLLGLGHGAGHRSKVLREGRQSTEQHDASGLSGANAERAGAQGADNAPSATPVKRPRGRPRKSAPVSQPTQQILPTPQAANSEAHAVSPGKSKSPEAVPAATVNVRRSSRRSMPELTSATVFQTPSRKTPDSTIGTPNVGPVSEPPPKRRRGRPPKIPRDPMLLAASQSSSAPGHVVGPQLTSSGSNETLSTTTMLKESKPSTAETVQQQAVPLKRKRGRPLGSGKQKTNVEAKSENVALQQISEEPVETMEVTGAASVVSRLSQDPTSLEAAQIAADVFDMDTSELSDLSEDEDEHTPSPSLDSESRQKRKMKRKRTSAQDKDKKRYHVTGLYAGEAEAVSATSSRTSGTESGNDIFPLPIHFGSKLLCEQRDFQLPFSLHQESEKLREKVNSKRKPPPYHRIRTNAYVSRPKLQGEVPLCYCEPSSKCGSDCMNRMLMFICDPKVCPCGDECTNISLGKRPTVKTEVAYYGGRGFGLKTLEPIKKGDFIDEYRGEVIDIAEVTKRVNEEYRATGNFYLLEYDSAAAEYLDGGRKGNITRFANHSCDPNCMIEKFIIRGTDESRTAEFQIGLFARRDIEAGEELTYNYGWEAFQPRDNMTGAPTAEVPPLTCLCGAANCVGVLGNKKAPIQKAAEKAESAAAKKVAKKRGRKKRTRVARAITPKLAATILTNAAQAPKKATNSTILLHKVGRRDSRRKQGEAAVKLAAKVATKRAENKYRAQTQSMATVGSSSKSMNETAGKSLPKEASSTSATKSVPVKPARKRGRKPKNAQNDLTSNAASDAGLAVFDDELARTGLAETETHQEVQASSTSVQRPSDGDASFEATRLPLGDNYSEMVDSALASPLKPARGKKDRRWSAVHAILSDDGAEDESGWEYEVSDSDDRGSDFHQQGDGPRRHPAGRGKEGRVRRRRSSKQPLSGEEAEQKAAERRARNAFLARVRRASKRGIIIEDPSQHPLKKISIQCDAAPENTYIPDLPSTLIELGMTTADARRARNAFLARVRRAVKRGYDKNVAIKMAAKPLPGDPAYDTPVMRAQRTYHEQLAREAGAELASNASETNYDADSTQDVPDGGNLLPRSQSSTWEDVSSWSANEATKRNQRLQGAEPVPA